MTTIEYLNVSTAAQLSADIKAIDLASRDFNGGNGERNISSRSRPARP